MICNRCGFEGLASEFHHIGDPADLILCPECTSSDVGGDGDE